MPHPTPTTRADRAQTQAPVRHVFNLLLALVAPVAVIRRGWRTMGLGYAFAIHVFGVVLWFVLFSIFEVFRNISYGWYDSFLITDVLDEVATAQPDEALLMLLGMALFAVMVESGFFALAWVVMPWGASPEPWRRSMNRGLIRLYQLTPFLAVSMVAAITCGFLIDQAGGYYDYRSDSYRDGISWELQALLSSMTWTVYFLSQLGALLWAVMVHTDRPGWAASCPWPAECEGCGYPLMGMDMSHDPSCPECGKPVSESVHSPRCRPDHRSLGEKMLKATFRPISFGQTLPLYRPTTGHRKALAVGAALLVCTAPLGMTLVWIIVGIVTGELEDDIFEPDSVIMFTSGIFTLSAVTVCVSVLAGLFGATVWGAYARVFRGRYALYPAAQGFAYQSGFFVLWAMGGYVVIGTVISIFESYDYGRYYGSRPLWVELLPFVIPLYFVVMAGVGFTLQGLLLRGARHGNG